METTSGGLMKWQTFSTNLPLNSPTIHHYITALIHFQFSAPPATWRLLIQLDNYRRHAEDAEEEIKINYSPNKTIIRLKKTSLGTAEFSSTTQGRIPHDSTNRSFFDAFRSWHDHCSDALFRGGSIRYGRSHMKGPITSHGSI